MKTASRPPFDQPIQFGIDLNDLFTDLLKATLEIRVAVQFARFDMTFKLALDFIQTLPVREVLEPQPRVTPQVAAGDCNECDCKADYFAYMLRNPTFHRFFLHSII